MTVLLVGIGYMGIEYAKVLNDLPDVEYIALGNSNSKVKAFEEATGHKAVTGGLAQYISANPTAPDFVILAVGIESLSACTHQLLDWGAKRILLEKPGVGYPEEIDPLLEKVKASNAKVLLAYNRRFYASVIAAKEIIKADGGVTSMVFEFTEWSHVIGGLEKHEAEHQNWFLGNSTHIIDTAFYLGGQPSELAAFHNGAGELTWHNRSCNYAGAGVTEDGALFSYFANWKSPGRWVIEIMTAKHRLVFKPIEQLQIQEIGSVAVNPVEGVDYSLDERYKPGLFLQTQAFLSGDDAEFCDLEEQAVHLKTYNEMSGY